MGAPERHHQITQPDMQMITTKEQAEALQRKVDSMKVGASVPSVGDVPMARGVNVRKTKMNKSEAAYDQYLDALYKSGRIAYYKFEAVTLKLGDDCRFSPDFMVLDPQGQVEFRDVKAAWGNGKPHIEDDAKAKMAVSASSLFPFFVFKVVWRDKATGRWLEKTL